MDKILTVNDVADVLKVKPITVREMLRTERIRGFKVGKAWRTTEKMLQEDIEKLSRGEAPEKLPKSNGVSNIESKLPRKSVKSTEQNKKKNVSASVENGSAQKKSAKPIEEAAVDTTQQLLF